ncbi:formylglycine-generating enzyme family protein [Elizabethkingia anophelis]|uniref:formylglycine-generating enzyme family protein n=1 Tax=Elizabethkingia anophelis TaxID=1117645 RepID=UPI001115F67C|nr:formylglycine-generating enzyme family protein [Elizabethkingia anophelis]MCT3675328.1 formylglycine-generating enzyme family protein [Elizabethkingia anophelis]MCT3679818.1 formylglycine-generating enzyme family protein [Elizabethkingia anophelis]MCT3757239.1 formylglycine-generating enzyme family protein [Elizabethkingia anophelis]MCT3768801.1 formylglycine-generating enzyme family protein [Elizabethkingia anophelis]MCT3773201.1 formylglycine-generating enzyme family protein [Elizabethkin
MMRNLIYILVIFFSISCSEKQDQKQPKPVSRVLMPVADTKKMLKIEGGSYKPFVGKETDILVKVKTFYLDETAVTNAEFLTFLKANPQWTKSKVLRLFADSAYLKHWKGDYKIPDDVSPEAPVTSVSWFAAKAYAESVGKRLPTVDEWEYVARADENNKNAAATPEFTQHILKLYQQKLMYKQPVKQSKPNVWGVYDLFGTIWEWTEDFSSVMMSGESRKDNTTNETLFCAGASVTSSDLKNYAAFIRFALRGSVKADYTINNLGFRCARDAKNQ